MRSLIIPVLAALAGAVAIARGDAGGLRLHPANHRIFEFRGNPTVLIGSTEHYGAVVNGDFNFIRYLDEIRANGLNFVRIFSGPYIERQGDFSIPENTLSPAQGSLILPWPRTDQDGPPAFGRKIDLSKWNPAFFHRLKRFVEEADKRDIVVEVTFFCPYYTDGVWEVSPMNPLNHINGVGAGGRLTVHQVGSDQLPFQLALVRKIMAELKGAGNVLYEPVNEPYTTGSGTTPEWEALIRNEIIAVQAGWENPHLIARNVANYSALIANPDPGVGIFNFHYATPDAALLNRGIGKAIGNDETGFVGGGNNNKDFPYRQQAWEFMLSGGATFNHLDYSFTADREDGIASPSAPIDNANPASSPRGGGGPPIRRQLGFLKWFLDQLPLVSGSPQPGFVTSGVPAGGVVRVFGGPTVGAPGAPVTYGLYLRGGSQADLLVDLPAGTYRGRWFDVRSGGMKQRLARFDHPGGPYTLSSPVYPGEIALLLVGGDQVDPEVELVSPLHRTIHPRNQPVTLVAEAAVDEGSISAVEFLDGDEVLGLASSAPFQITVNNPAPGKRLFRARARTADGRSAYSPPVKCQIVGAFHSGVNLNGSEADFGSYLLTASVDAVAQGMILSNFSNQTTTAGVEFYPEPDPVTQSLVSSQIVRSSTADLSIAYPLPNGTYDVFLSIVEGERDYGRDIRARIEGVAVAKGIGFLSLGEWVNYGPYRTKIVDGVLNIGLGRETLILNNPASPLPPKIAGFSVYLADPASDPESATLQIRNAPGLALLSWPAGVSKDRVESSVSPQPTDIWQPLALPAEEFPGFRQIAVPTDEPRRFFRLRRD